MEIQDSIKKIFQSYFGKHISKEGQNVFGAWLCTPGYEKEKELQLNELWEKVDGEITEKTDEGWRTLNSLIYKPSRKKIYLQLTKYAAVLLVLITTGLVLLENIVFKPVNMLEVFVPYSETRIIYLPDSTKVWINSGSMIVYPEDFTRLDTRSVYLVGEASFSVTKDKKPFIVKTSDMDVRALGTLFTIDAYANENLTTTTLEEGRVLVRMRNKIHSTYILKPSEQLVYNRTTGDVQKPMVDTSYFKKTRQGYLIFVDASFKEIISDLEKRFGMTIQFNSTRYDSDLYNIKFGLNESIENIMEVLHQLVGIDYVINDKCIIIK